MLAINKEEWRTLPEQARQEVYDFFLFVKQRYKKKTGIDPDTVETLSYSNHSANTIEDWINEEEDDIWK